MHTRSPLDVRFTRVHHVSRSYLEPLQDLLVLGLAVALFGLMARTLVGLVAEIVAPTVDVRSLLAQILFMLVMVELVRLLVIYLQEHRVAVDFMVELGIVATLREIVLQGAVELTWEQLVAVSVFLLALGALLRFADLRYPGVTDVDSAPDGAASDRALTRRKS